MLRSHTAVTIPEEDRSDLSRTEFPFPHFHKVRFLGNKRNQISGVHAKSKQASYELIL